MVGPLIVLCIERASVDASAAVTLIPFATLFIPSASFRIPKVTVADAILISRTLIAPNCTVAADPRLTCCDVRRPTILIVTANRTEALAGSPRYITPRSLVDHISERFALISSIFDQLSAVVEPECPRGHRRKTETKRNDGDRNAFVIQRARLHRNCFLNRGSLFHHGHSFFVRVVLHGYLS